MFVNARAGNKTKSDPTYAVALRFCKFVNTCYSDAINISTRIKASTNTCIYVTQSEYRYVISYTASLQRSALATTADDGSSCASGFKRRFH